MSFGLGVGIIYDTRNGEVIRSYRTIGAAKGSFTRKYSKQPHLKVCTYEDYQTSGAITANEMVTVKNLLSGKDIQIRRVDVGGACDPSTERYHCM